MSVLRVKPERAVLIVVDLQDKLVRNMDAGDDLLRQCEKLIRGCRVLGVPVMGTEQYPAGLGATLPGIREAMGPDAPIEAKLKFSGMVEPVRKHLSRLGRPVVILCGIEAHVCLIQTALDLLGAGYVAVVCMDAISSRRARDRELAIRRLTQAGAIVASVEMVLFEMTHEAGTDRFKALLPVVK